MVVGMGVNAVIISTVNVVLVDTVLVGMVLIGVDMDMAVDVMATGATETVVMVGI